VEEYPLAGGGGGISATVGGGGASFVGIGGVTGLFSAKVVGAGAETSSFQYFISIPGSNFLWTQNYLMPKLPSRRL
jgi:hypothetical protein